MRIQEDIARLASLRRGKDLSLSAIAVQTKIRPCYIQAIEEGNLDLLPRGSYRLSFLKQYAESIDSGIARQLPRSLADLEAARQRPADPPSWKMWMCRGLTACLGLIMPAAAQTETTRQANLRPAADPRHRALVKFFKANDSPLTGYVSDFLSAADKHRLDWRLLPGLAMAESSGGKYFINRNIFGWNSGRTKFDSVRISIDYVASRLARSKPYAGKDLVSIIQAYNPLHKDYPERVLKHIRRMSPEPLPVFAAQAR